MLPLGQPFFLQHQQFSYPWYSFSAVFAVPFPGVYLDFRISLAALPAPLATYPRGV